MSETGTIWRRQAEGQPWQAAKQGEALYSGDLLKAINQGNADCPVLDAGTTDLVTAVPSESVRDALLAMFQRDVGRLPVVDEDDQTKLLGYLSRANVMSAHMKRLQEEQESA